LLFTGYLSFLGYLLFYLPVVNSSLNEKLGYQIHWIPFKSIPFSFHLATVNHQVSLLILMYILRILLFSPLGIFLPFVLKRQITLNKMIMLSILISLSIEIIHFVQRFGANIDSFILNFIGMLIGFWIYLLIKPLAIKLKNYSISYN
jgi:glycopeptide antibiotics resistance protein